MTSRRVATASAAAVAAALSLATAGPTAAVPRDFFGVVSLESPSAPEFATLGRGKVGTLRVVLGWANVEPQQGERNWAPYDALFEQAALQGIRVMPTLYGSPSFAAPKIERPPTSKTGRRAWRQFVADAAARYGRGGEFWRLFALRHPRTPALPPTYWQLWNEVNSPSFWLRRPKPGQYVRLLKPTSRAIRDFDPQAQIVLAGLFTRPGQKRAVPVPRYMAGLYRIRKVKKLFDAVAVHPYAANPRRAMKAVREMRRILSSHRDAATEIWITEMGWATSGVKTKFTKSLETQAEYLQRSFSAFVSRSARYRIAGVIWYSLRDNLGGDDWLFRTGLFEADGRPKPAWYSFVSFTGGAP